MNYKLESVNSCTRKLLFQFENLDLSTEIKREVLNKQKNSNLKGFRKGKAPVAMVQKLFGPQIENDALNNFIRGQIFSAITKENLKMVGTPSLDNVKYDAGKSVSFDATVEVFPEIKLKDYSKFSFKKEHSEVTEQDLNDVKKDYLSSRAEMREIEDSKVTVAKGLFAVINFEGERADGSKPQNMKGTEYLLEIGSNSFIPGFEEGVVGMKKGDKKVLELTFPADYHMAEMQNEKVKFSVEVLEIKEKKIPEFTEELAKEFGYLSVEDFMTKNKALLKAQKEKKSLQQLNESVIGKLIEENSFDVPAAMVVAQEKYLKEDMAKNLKQQGLSENMLKDYFVKWEKELFKRAEHQVKSGLILESLALEFKIEVGEKDLDEKFAEVAGTSSLPLSDVKDFYLKNDNMKKNLTYAIKEEKTFEKLKSLMKIS